VRSVSPSRIVGSRLSPRPESGGFCSHSVPTSLPLRSTQLPPSCRPGFEFVPQWRVSPFRSLARLPRFDARTCSARSARLNLHNRANAPQRVFPLSDRQRDAVCPLVCPRCPPFAPDCELSIPLERLRLETRRLALPRGRSIGQFLKPPLHSAFWSVRFSATRFPIAGGQTKRSIPLTAFEISKRAGERASVMLHARP
jgi:hypothetical protein